MSDKEQDTPIIDLSSDETKRQTFRKLLVVLIGSIVGSLFLMFLYPWPEGIQIAMALESEMASPWKANLELLTTIGFLGLLLWSLYELWNFRSAGLGKLALTAFAPLFLLQTAPLVANPFDSYVTSIWNVLTGMVLFMGWAFPSIFRSENKSPNTSSQTEAG